MSHSLRAGAAVAASVVVLAIVACETTADPRAGSRKEGASAGGGSSSSSGGSDAALPDKPIDCGPAPGASDPFSKGALLRAAGSCAAWHSCNFLNAASSLRKSVRAYASAPSDSGRADVQTQWRAAMNEWSKNELFQFGPVASRVVDMYHGRGLRSFVNPWPDLNRCQIEAQITSKGYAQGWDLVFPSSRGLFAIEYLAFYPGSDTACQPASPTGQAWSALAPADLAKAKNDYATAVADNVAAVALEIHDVWLPEGENFGQKLATFDAYGTDQEALTVVAWSLIYVEKEVKDLKLAPIAGVDATPPNPETPFARVDIENVRANLRGFQSLFQGCGADGAGIGYDDWLVSAGHAQLSQDILTAYANAQAAADAFPPFSQATQPQLVSLYDSIRTLTNLLKGNFFGSASPLNLRLPAGVASDTD